jgi:hypothetical protein
MDASTKACSFSSLAGALSFLDDVTRHPPTPYKSPGTSLASVFFLLC